LDDVTTPAGVLSERSVALLTSLLSPENLEMDISLVSLPTTSTKKAQFSVDEAFTAILQQRRHGHAFEALSFDTLTNAGATTMLTHLQSTVNTLSSLSAVYADICLAERAVSWEIARSLTIISRWYTSDGPALAHQIFDIHKVDKSAGLQVRFPIFASLVDRILAYVMAIHASKPGLKSSTRLKGNSTSHASEMSVEALRDVPLAFFGLNEPLERTYCLPAITPRMVGSDSDRHYFLAEQCFVRAISDIFISDHLKATDARLNGPGRIGSSGTPKLGDFHPWIRRTIIRGAAIDAIVEACDGDDGILASKTVEGLLKSPVLFYSTEHHETNDNNLSRKLANGDPSPLQPLRSWLKDFIHRSPGTLTQARKLGDKVYERMCSLHGLQSFPRFNALVLSASAKSHKSISRRLKSPSKALLPEVPLTLEVLLPSRDEFNFSELGLIMREALNKRRSLPVGDIRISRLMQGMHPTTGLATGKQDLDHFNPIRLDNTYARMLKEQFTDDRIVGPYFLQNLFVWMSTGQGLVTAQFVKFTDLWFEDLQPCIRVFRNAHAANDVKFYNTRIWGTTCASFAVETKRFTIEEKFTPFFDKTVTETWKKFLGERYQSSGPYSGPLPSFTEALALLNGLCKKLKLHGFNDGLTNLQFANNLASLDLCQPPTIDEIAGWIYRHQTKGAFKGLLAMGFKLKGRPEHWTKAAFQCVYDHISATLSPEDRAELRFGTIFVEHILCKVSRFAYLIRKAVRSRKSSSQATPLTLHKIARDAALSVSQFNHSDHPGKKMPIPAASNASRLHTSVQLWA
jgi:hypothetical protein